MKRNRLTKKIDYPLYSPRESPRLKSKREKLTEISLPKKIVATATVKNKTPIKKEEIDELKNEIDLLTDENKELELKNEELKDKIKIIEEQCKEYETKLKQIENQLNEMNNETNNLRSEIHERLEEKQKLEVEYNNITREYHSIKKKNLELDKTIELMKQEIKDLRESQLARIKEAEERELARKMRKEYKMVPSIVGPFSSFMDIQQVSGEQKWECICKNTIADKRLEFIIERMSDGTIEYLPLSFVIKDISVNLTEIPEYVGRIIQFNEDNLPNFLAKMISFIYDC